MKIKKERKTLLECAAGEIKWHYLIQSLGELILGIVLIALPSQRISILCIAMGILLMVYGGINIYTFVINNWNDIFGDQMLYGIILTALGLAFLTRRNDMMMLTSVVFGILIIIDSIIDLRRALLFRKASYKYWYILLILTLVTAVFGTLFIVRPDIFGEALMLVIGALLIYEAVSTFVLLFIISRLKDHLATSAPAAQTGIGTPENAFMTSQNNQDIL